MVAIRELEKLLAPYESDWGASDSCNFQTTYKKDGVKVRIDSASWWMKSNPRKIYRDELVKAIIQLGLLPDR